MTEPLRGSISVVPDKSLTHRGVILGALSEGTTVLGNPNPGADCRATLRAVNQLGATVRTETDRWVIGGGRDRLRAQDQRYDFGNSGTGLRLFAGMVAGLPLQAHLTGDESLRRRPMGRIVEPLRAMGAQITTEAGDRAPLSVSGGRLRGLQYDLPIASAQVKSAILLAGLSLEQGEIRLREPGPSRDHTERLLPFLGARLEHDNQRNQIVLRAPNRIEARDWTVSGDFSAAAFFLVAGAITPGSEVRLMKVGLNPTRTGALDVLQRMGADLRIERFDQSGPEPEGDISIRYSNLRSTQVGGGEIGRLLDEIPVLAVAAAMAEGETRFENISELRLKESDRIRSTCELLRRLGVEVEEETDALTVRGQGRLGGGFIDTEQDHRIAMAALVAGCASEDDVVIDSTGMIGTSDPLFLEALEGLRKGETP